MYKRQIKALRATEEFIRGEAKNGADYHERSTLTCHLCIEFECYECPLFKMGGCDEIEFNEFGYDEAPIEYILSFIWQLRMFYEEEAEK